MMCVLYIVFCFFIFFLLLIFFFFFFFFFQAEDGIRDRDVTGVQTCALPISPIGREPHARSLRRGQYECFVLAPQCHHGGASGPDTYERRADEPGGHPLRGPHSSGGGEGSRATVEIGRASCRERVEDWGCDGS